MTWFDKILPLLGVLIGALMTPWVTNRIEKGREKLLLRRELIKSVHIFFNLWKEGIMLLNNRDFSTRLAYFMSYSLSHHQLDPILRAEKTREHKIIMKDIFNMNATHEVNYHKMMEIEADILSALAQSKRFYSSDTTLKLSQLLRPLIDQSNAQFEFYDYALLDESGIDEAKRALPNLLRGKHKEMDAECKKAIDELLSFF